MFLQSPGNAFHAEIAVWLEIPLAFPRQDVIINSIAGFQTFSGSTMKIYHYWVEKLGAIQVGDSVQPTRVYGYSDISHRGGVRRHRRQPGRGAAGERRGDGVGISGAADPRGDRPGVFTGKHRHAQPLRGAGAEFRKAGLYRRGCE